MAEAKKRKKNCIHQSHYAQQHAEKPERQSVLEAFKANFKIGFRNQLRQYVFGERLRLSFSRIVVIPAASRALLYARVSIVMSFRRVKVIATSHTVSTLRM
jgi:hypothetical protein